MGTRVRWLGAVLCTALLGWACAPASAAPVVSATITVGANPSGVAFTPDGMRAYVTNAGSDSVSVIDTSTNQTTGEIDVGDGPSDVAISPNGKLAYVTNADGDSVSVIDTSTNQTVGTEIRVGHRPTGVAMTPDGTRAYIVNQFESTVSVIFTVTNQFIGDPIAAGPDPFAVAITPDGSRAYVTDASSSWVRAIATGTGQVLGDPIDVGSEQFGLAVSPDGKAVYVANYMYQSVSVIDTGTDQTIGDPIYVLFGPYGVAFAPDGRRAYVTTYDRGAVAMIDTATRTVVGDPVLVGDGPTDVAVSPDGTRAYVTNSWGNTVSVLALQPSPPHSVTSSSGDSRVEVAWQEPSFTGGQPISSYTATASPGGNTCTTAGATTCTITGLTNGTAYTVSVTATNSIGTSAPSTPSAPATPSRAVLTLTPPSADFGTQRIGTTVTTSLTATNTGHQPVTIIGTTVTGDAFTLDPGACAAATLSAGQTCAFSARFTPTQPSAYAGTVTVTSNADPVTATLTGTGAPSTKKKQTLKANLPKRIKRSGLTVITPANARTNAGQLVRTIVRGGPTKPTTAREVRHFTVVRGPAGKTSIRTHGYPNLGLRITQNAPATTRYTAFTRTATYTKGKRG